MRGIKMYGLPAVGALVLAVTVGTASAAAANWDPNTPVAGSGTLTYSTNTGASLSCTMTVRTTAAANSDLATTVNGAGAASGPVFENCTNNLVVGTTDVDTVSAWRLTATSTTAVDLTIPSMTITIGDGLCSIHHGQDLGVANNTWSNANHTLTFNSSVNIPIVETGICDGGSTGHWSGTVTFPASTSIT